jgi:hypothetical protein
MNQGFDSPRGYQTACPDGAARHVLRAFAYLHHDPPFFLRILSLSWSRSIDCGGPPLCQQIAQVGPPPESQPPHDPLAKGENILSTSDEPHRGHTISASEDMTSSSKVFPQLQQQYSKIGMLGILLVGTRR